MRSEGMSLTISGESLEEIKDKLRAAAKSFGVLEGEEPRAARGTKRTREEPAAASIVAAPALTNGHAKEADIDPFETGAATPAAAKVPTREDITNALQLVNSKKGMGEVKKIIEKFGCRKLSEVQEKDFAAFIQSCQQAAS